MPHRVARAFNLRRPLLVLLAALACARAADDAGRTPRPPAKPKPRPAAAAKPKLSAAAPAGGAGGAGLKLGGVGMAATASKYAALARPYLKNPLALPAGTKWFAGLFVCSLWFLLQALTGVLWLVLDPASVVLKLCLGTALFHASWMALRGPREQLRRLTQAERMPHTMTTAVTLLAAGYAALKKERIASYLSSPPPAGMHLTALVMDPNPSPTLTLAQACT